MWTSDQGAGGNSRLLPTALDSPWGLEAEGREVWLSPELCRSYWVPGVTTKADRRTTLETLQTLGKGHSSRACSFP